MTLKNPLSLLAALPALTLLAAACASIGSPDGGPYDETPPQVVRCFPANQAVNSDKKRIAILFNEYVKLDGANENIVVSPPQQEMPNIRAEGKRVKIDLYDTLTANTTYTIDFGDAIVDNNEGNPLGLFTYTFSTGGHIDTMEVAGTVLNAADLEPIKGILVGLQSNLADSAFTTQPLSRVARTNGSGRFTIKGVAPGRYRIFALKDADGDFRFSQKSELIAFDTTVIEPTCGPDVRFDTLWRDTVHYDSIRAVPYTHFYPDDIVLKAFLEEGQDHHLLKTERPVPDRFTLYFTAPADTLPVIRGLNFDSRNAFIVEPSAHNDTITYWIPDTTLAYMDTLALALTYLDTDSLKQLSPRTDTLELAPKVTRARQLKELRDKIEAWEKEQKKKRRRNKDTTRTAENPFLHQYLECSFYPGGSIDPDQNITVTFNEPLSRIDTTALHFYQRVDTNWVEAPFLFLPVEGALRKYRLYAEWRPKQQYKFETDSLAFTNIFGVSTRPLKQEIRVRSLDDYSSLFVKLELPDTGAVVQLLNKSDKVMRTVRATGDGRADFFFVKPGEYYMRLFIDRNGNERWDTGDYASGQQAEEVFYFPKPLLLRAKWEVEQTWDVRGIPLTRQKASEITKQKPDKDKKIKNRNAEREREMNSKR